jgi:putative sigma-54 modulation protein
MNIEFVARRVRLDPGVREIVEKKLAKLAKVLPKDAQAHVVVERMKKDYAVEVTVVGRQRTWTAKEIGQDQQAAAHAVLDRIGSQAKKTKSKVREEKKHRAPGGVRSPEVWVPPASASAPSDGDRPLGPRSEQVTARPMFEEDALHRFTSRDQDVLVFRDPSSDSLRVLYRRRDGSLGLLIPS